MKKTHLINSADFAELQKLWISESDIQKENIIIKK